MGCVGCVGSHPKLTLRVRGGRVIASMDAYIRPWELAIRQLGFRYQCGENVHHSISLEWAIHGLCAHGVLCNHIALYLDEQQQQASAQVNTAATTMAAADTFCHDDDVPMGEQEQPSWQKVSARNRPTNCEDEPAAQRRRLLPNWL